eukprot:PhF_6_TR40641/c0_g1_i1/m.61019/K14410/ACP2; lysosomal acid phosphatase
MMNGIVFVLFIFAVCAKELKHLTIVHRHGARLPAEVVAGQLNWDHADLTDQGKDMCLKLGQFTRDRYSAFLPTALESVTTASRATDYDRTRQSGAMVLKGLYPGQNDYPILKYLPNSMEFLLRFKTPSVGLKRSDNDAGVYADMEKMINKTMTPADLSDVGASINQAALCSSTPSLCLLLAHEFAMSNYANGQPMNPLWAKHLNYDKWMAYYYHHTEAYLADEQFRDNVGGNGYRLLQDILNTPKSKPTIKVSHYSGHDNTMIGLYATLGVLKYGDEESTRNIPNFAETIYFEQYDDNTISIVWGYPNQLAGSNHSMQVWPLEVSCMSTMKAVYSASTCPIDDFRRYLDAYQAPKSPDTTCYGDPRDLETYGCLATNTTPGKVCLTYRTACPIQACPPNTFLDTRNNYMCITTSSTNVSPKPSSSNSTDDGETMNKPLSTGAALGIAGGCVALVIIFLVVVYRSREETRRMSEINKDIGESMLPR